MKYLNLLPLILFALSLSASAQDGACLSGKACKACCKEKSVYDFSVADMNGDTIRLCQYKGKVLLIVNTATRCGFTPQYEELQRLHEQYADRGLVILDFPCNQFGAQAPGTAEEIHAFCSANFNIGFPQMEKVNVNGPDALPLFAYLKQSLPFKGFDLTDERGAFMDQMLRKQDPDFDKKADVKWNFTKFLVSSTGQPLRRFEPTESMTAVEQCIRELLK